MTPIRKKSFTDYWLSILPVLLLGFSPQLMGQEDEEEGEIYSLSPFEVSSTEDVGYLASSTLAGTRIRTDLRDVGSAISVVTAEFLEDTGVTDNESLLVYTASSETGGINGSYSGGVTDGESNNLLRPNSNNRIRGLFAADNTRDFFLTDIPWDGYNVDRIDLQRGPNAILFGLGSPAGIINATTTGANFLGSKGEIEARYGSYGSVRATLNYNLVVLEDELAIRVAGLYDDREFRQDPAWSRDKRYFVAAKYEPAALQSDSMTTTLKLNYEQGNIDSNRPRTRPPIDRLTTYFQNGNRVFDMEAAWNYDPAIPNSGVLSGGSGAFNPLVSQLFGGPNVRFPNPGESTTSGAMVSEIQMSDRFGRAADGSIDNTIQGFQFQRYVQPAAFSEVAQNANFQYTDTLGGWQNKSITDRSTFDYERQLIDGPNKWERREFDTWNASLAQTFLNNKVGYEFAVDHQNYEDAKANTFNNPTISVDINTRMADGTPNPNVHRPVMYSRTNNGNFSKNTIRDSYRLTTFAEIDFRDSESDSWLSKLLGRHVFTGLLSKDEIVQHDREWFRYLMDDGFAVFSDHRDITQAEREIQFMSYLGGSLQSASSPAGLNLSRLDAMQVPVVSTIRMFDSNWNAPGVDPATPWTTTYGSTTRELTESENPANYVGWIDYPARILDADNGDLMGTTRLARKSKQEIESKALVWQGYLWDGLLVPTIGYREDEADSFKRDGVQSLPGNVIDLNDPSYVFASTPDNSVEGDGWTYSMVVHTDKLIKLPGDVRLSLFYNESSNFQPAANRVDQFNQPLGAPSGETQDMGFVLSDKDNRWVFKANWYEASVAGASFDPGNLWFLGGVETRAWVAAKVFEANLDGVAGFEDNFYRAFEGQTEEEALALQRTHVDAVLSNVASDEFWAAWGAQKTETRWQNFAWDPWSEGGFVPQGITSTADNTSEGLELELTVNPTNNWSILMNASKVEAKNSNLAGSLKAWVEERNEVYNGVAGDIRMWWGGGTSSIKQQWNNNFYSRYLLAVQKEGTNVDELREWRVNIITNYRFNEGRLKGFNVGGSLRWEDDIGIGYPILSGANGDTFDINNPFKAPSEEHYDFWLGYSKKLTDKIDWRIQLNVRDAFADGGLVPINVQPDGSPAQFRLAPYREWYITNTFKF